MRLTIIQTGEVPAPLRARFGIYVPMFERMFARAGAGFPIERVPVLDGAPLPDPKQLEAVLITGSAAGVYEDHAWLDPLRHFIRAAYAAGTPMVGVCFGHQIMADALGGTVLKSEKGWGLGRHSYSVVRRPDFLENAGVSLAVACSHQDQVVSPPAGAEFFLASDFTPHAGLIYANGRAISVQPHPEFEDDYARALVELRRGRAPDDIVDAAIASFATPSDSLVLARGISHFLLTGASAEPQPAV